MCFRFYSPTMPSLVLAVKSTDAENLFYKGFWTNYEYDRKGSLKNSFS
jgi:hypothetical protein